MELNNKVGKTTYTVEIPSQIGLLDPSSLIEEENDSNIDFIEVMDIQGKVILQTKNIEDMNRLSKGLYIVKIVYADGRLANKKIGL